MSKYLPCETCPQRLEFQERADHPELMRDFIANDAPDPSDSFVSQIISESKAIQEGMEAARPECPGYRPGRMVLGMLSDKIEGGAFVSAEERHCNNPFMRTPEYVELRDGMTRGSLRERNNKDRRANDLPPAKPNLPRGLAIPKFQRFIASLAVAGASESFVRSSNNAIEGIAVGGLSFAVAYYGSELLARRIYSRREASQ